ncbi:urea ABC transporter permease subunit UrtB [Methylohalobius crimeensis]|uniref:urea ABC transporter permease subunit UrtB n=1 Tax=Methylohalobius crimeensis TaxID=244365 RepID=UPI0003B7A969|nr:urea ABC transporter permease subunit UrtB [Methylohalobius crimeensis]
MQTVNFHHHPWHRSFPIGLGWVLMLAILTAQAADPTSGQATLGKVLEGLTVRSFSQKKAAVKNLAAVDHPRVLPVMKALLEGDLYYRKIGRQVLILRSRDAEYAIYDAVTGESLGSGDKKGLSKIIINNQMRVILRDAIARLSLASENAGVRLAAVEEMFDRLSPGDAKLLRDMRETERHPEVLEAIDTGLALEALDSGDENRRLAAVDTLSRSVNRTVRNRLKQLLESNLDGSPREASAKVRAAARKALAAINQRLEMYAMVQTGFFGLSLGSVLLLSAIGLAITFGVMGVINMAHGEMMMLGAYTTYLVQQLMPGWIDASVIVAIPAAFVVSGLMGIAVERGVIRYLYGRPLETLLATFGISLLLQQLVRTLISAQNVAVENPAWMSGAWEVNAALFLTYNRLYILAFSLLVFAALFLILRQTDFGLQIRAVSQNRAMARAIGIRSNWVDAATFGLGSGIAGVAGVALSQLTNVGPNLGQSYIIDSFMVVVFGGVGNLWGTLVGALGLGLVNKLLEPWAGAVMAKILVLVFIILFMQKHPRGLFPQRGRSAED